MKRRGVGKILSVRIDSSIATLVLAIRSGTITVHGEVRPTLEALCSIFDVPPKPAPPTDLRGRRVGYRRDGQLLVELGEA